MKKITLTVLLDNELEPVSINASHDLTPDERDQILESLNQSEHTINQLNNALYDALTHPSVVRLI